MKKNKSLISLDLRDNTGFTKEYSLYIFKKLKKNLQNYKKQKIELLQQRDLTLNSEKKRDQNYKSLEESRRNSLQPRGKNNNSANKM